MYKIEKTDFGIKLTFSGYIPVDEMIKWRDESIEFLKQFKKKYCIIVDMRELKPLVKDAEEILKDGQKYYRQDDNPKEGIERSAVLVKSVVTKIQMARISRETGLNKVERFFAEEDFNWKKKADDWIYKAIDSDE